MRKLFSKTTLAAGFALALAFTFLGCPGGGGSLGDLFNYVVTVNGGSGGGSYPQGSVVNISATVPSGQQFQSWTVNFGGVALNNPNSASTSFTMPANNVTVSANFTGGNVTPTPTPASSSSGGNVTPTPTPASSSSVMDGGTGIGSEANPIPLTSNVWADGNITSDLTKTGLWYSFNVTAGATYRVWWNQSNAVGHGNGTKTLRVHVSATHSDGTKIFTNVEGGWGTAQQFIATSNGTVKLKVIPMYPNHTGTFGIVYSSTNTISRPSITGNPGSDESIPIALTAGTWAIGNIVSGEWVWYSINVANGNMYYIWWNDSGQGDKTHSADVSVLVYNRDGTVLSSEVAAGWTTPKSFIANSNGTVLVRVRGLSNGTYGIVYNTSNTRP